MTRQNNILILLICLLLPLADIGNAQDIMMQVLKPEEKSIYTEDSVAFVIRVDPESFDTIKILPNKNKAIIITPVAKLDTYCQNIPLYPGSNRIHIRVYAQGEIAAEVIRNIYYTSPLSKEDNYPPGEYAHTFFHTEDEEGLCTGCHDMRLNEKKNIAFIDVTQSNCYLCHKSINAKEQGHSPSVNWLCTNCHSGSAQESNTTAKSRFLTPKPAVQTCFNCHEMKKRIWKEKRYKHYPVATGRCDYCHNPHSSRNRFMLHKPSWDLCRSCHSNKPGRQAYLKKFQELGGHPMDPKISGRELSCTSCHNPHVSDRTFFLQPDYSGDRSICQW